MPKGGKRKGKFEGNADDKQKPSKLVKTRNEDDDSESIHICELSRNRQVNVRTWKGQIWVDIRDFYDKDGKTLPGKKGICLSMDQWNILRDHIKEIDEAVAEKS